MGVSNCSLAQSTVQNPIQKLVRGTLDTPIIYIHDQAAYFPGMIQTLQ